MNVNCCTNVKLTRLLYKMIFCDWIIINDLLGHQHEAQGLFPCQNSTHPGRFLVNLLM